MANDTSENSTKTEDKVALDVSDPRRFFCDRAFILNNDEHFILALQTGSVVEGQYAFTPKHMKRLLLLLQEKIKEYEEKYGEIEAKLPKAA